MWVFSDRVVDFSPGTPAAILGIVNVTPDSFSDGGKYLGPETAIAHGISLVQQGADIVDVGGESTRPDATPVPVDEEMARVLPVVEGLVANNILVSVDTSKAAVADRMLAAGAKIINDVTAGRDPAMADVVKKHKAGVILMHMQGTPQTMQLDPRYDDVAREVAAELGERIEAFTAAGVAREAIAIDPGVGFGKTFDHNLELIARLEELTSLGRPVCLGVSRKGFIGRITDRPRHQRAVGSAAIAAYCLARGTCQIVRAHDVPETRDIVRMVAALKRAER